MAIIKINGTVTTFTGTSADIAPTTRLSALSDVNITSAISNQYLKWDGANWINDTLTGGDISFTDLTLSGNLTVNGQTNLNGTFDDPIILSNSQDGGGLKMFAYDYDTSVGALQMRTSNFYRTLLLNPVATAPGLDDGTHNTELRMYGDTKTSLISRTPISNTLTKLVLQNKNTQINTVNDFSILINDTDRLLMDDTETNMLVDYTRPLRLYGEPGVENGNIKMWVYGGFGGVLDAIGITTENNKEILRLVSYDTGGGDDGSHEGVLVVRGSDNSILSRNTGGGLGSNVPLTVKAQDINVRVDDSYTVHVAGSTVIDANDTLVEISTDVQTLANLTVDGDITGSSLTTGSSGGFFNDPGTINGYYLNIQTPANFSSSAQLVHPMNTGDTFHQMLRMRTDMTTQTPYSHSLSLFAETKSQANGIETIGEWTFTYQASGEHYFRLGVDNVINGVELNKNPIRGGYRSVDFESMIQMFSVPASAAAPGSPSDGDHYFDTVLKELRFWADGWQTIDPDSGGVIYDNTNHRTLIYQDGAWAVVNTTLL